MYIQRNETGLYLYIAEKLLACEKHEEALNYFRKAYEQDGDSLKVLLYIEKYYVLPQEQRFKENYARNCEMIDFTFRYEDCQFNFIPSSDGTYEVFDKGEGKFCGSFDYSDYKNRPMGNKTFQSVLIADTGDARDILDILNNHLWNTAYIVLNNAIGKFMSFFKLLDFTAFLPNNVHIFEDTKKLVDFLAQNPDMYLPRVIYASDQIKYEAMIEKIHQKRIQSERQGKNVFLSICIPSYNRGKLALSAVQHDLQMKYDAEVEIIVSNNGSSIGLEEYKSIENIKDSRVQYFELERNMGIGFNICNCLEKARGHFAILFSDEDSLFFDGLDELLDHLFTHMDLGGFVSDYTINSTEKCGARKSKKFQTGVYRKGIEAAIFSLYTCYVTGVGFNLLYLRKYSNIFECIKNSDKSKYSMECIYPHSAIFEFLAEYFDLEKIEITIAAYGIPSKIGGFEGIEDRKDVVFSYQKPENIINLQTSQLLISEAFLSLSDYKKLFFRCTSFCIGSIASSFRDLEDIMRKQYNWTDIHISVYQNCLQILRESKWGIEAFDEKFFHDLDEVFFDWLDCRRIRSAYSEKENFKATLRAQMARYCYDQGVPFLEIDFRAIDESLETIIEQAVPGEKSI